MTVSVVIPAHRVDDWLTEAVDSVLANDGVDIELIIVLNGTSVPAAPPWLGHPQITLLHHHDALGPTRAMIRGVEQSRGEFIARLDADDRMSPARLKAQLAWLETHPETTLVGSAAHRITARGERAGAIRIPTGADVRRTLVLFNCVPHSSVMFRRTDLDSVGGYNPELDQMEDYDLILRLGQRGAVSVLSEELIDYRVHATQTSRGAKPYGRHIREIGVQRRRLGRAVGMGWFAVTARASVWRMVQFARYFGVTKPGHEY